MWPYVRRGATANWKRRNCGCEKRRRESLGESSRRTPSIIARFVPIAIFVRRRRRWWWLRRGNRRLGFIRKGRTSSPTKFHLVILSEAKDLLSGSTSKKQVLPLRLRSGSG